MLPYIGNSPYCYANSAAMLLGNVGESVEPRLIEVLSGVGLGAFWVAESQTLYLSGWASAPDVGVSRSFRLLGFDVVEEAEADGAPMPVEALTVQLNEGPVMLGPLDMGELPYHPNAPGANGVDHYVLALHAEDVAVVVHDPAGYPSMPVDVEALDRAWKAELVAYRKGRYRRWHTAVRVNDPTPRQIADAAVQSFAQAYKDARSTGDPEPVVGPEAVEALAAAVECRELHNHGLEHLLRFALPLGVRRSLDYSWYLGGFNPGLADLKGRQAWHLARAHATACRHNWEALAENLRHVADLEHKLETSLVEKDL